jgi:predicted DNA-binding transcriptional regulator YafY
LAATLGFSERTVRNDLDFLRDRYNAPLEWERQSGYYYSDPNWRFDSIPLTRGELFALTLGARMLQAYAGTAYASELKSAIEQLSRRIPEQTRVDLQHLAEELISFRSGAEIDLDPDIWHKLEEACQQRKTVFMTYYTASRNDTNKRNFDPYLLYIYRGTNPYVIGFCHKRQEVRWFRVDRIRKLEVLAETFFPDPSFDPKDHLESIFQHEAGGVPQGVAIWFDAKTAPYVRERRWHPTQEIAEHEDGSLTLRMFVRGMNDIKRWILFYGAGAKALAPPELVKMVKEEAAFMTANYKS